MLDRRGVNADVAGPGVSTGSAGTLPTSPMSSIGTTTESSSVLRTPVSTMVTGRGWPWL
ncbi:unannotated protein [freshwater metagenome]|uniref:Unannotated protein n=1 Tax=freshwater metagenome TaxID=449393 RepID=A0A6J6EDV0_9ZZZZ